MKFTKMHGAGNDFIIINNIIEHIPEDWLSSLALKICTRRTSVGADGLIVVDKAKGKADFSMLFFNSDGSLGEMCGNGARCVCRYGFDNGLSRECQRIETSAGLVTGERISQTQYKIRLNDPSILIPHKAVYLDRETYDAGYIELGAPGIPHCIIRMDNWKEVDISVLKDLGCRLRYHTDFPKGANVSFVSVLDRKHLDAITFERGVEDFTLACGTGCGSAVTLLALRGDIDNDEVSVSMPGGELFVSAEIIDATVRKLYLTGPTCTVAVGEIIDC